MNNLKTDKKRIIIWVSVSVCLMVLFLGAKVSKEAKTVTLRNAADSLMLLIELETESGEDYIQAKAAHVEMLRKYARHMGRRRMPLLFGLSPFSKNIVKELKRIAGDLEKADQTNAREAIERASESIAEFLTKSKPFTDEAIIAFESEVMSEEIQDTIRDSLEKAHEKAEIYANDKNMANSEAAHQASRKAMVYLYLARSGYQEIVDEEKLRMFRTDINRCIYYNRALQHSDIVKGGKGVKDSDYWLLDRRSYSDILRLRLLQLIIDNDFQQAQALLQIAVKESTDIQF